MKFTEYLNKHINDAQRRGDQIKRIYLNQNALVEIACEAGQEIYNIDNPMLSFREAILARPYRGIPVGLIGDRKRQHGPAACDLEIIMQMPDWEKN